MLKMKALIVYFSLTGNTEKLALLLEEELINRGLDVEKIKVEGGEGSFMGECLRALFQQKVSLEGKDVGPYDLILIGSPVWAFSPVPAILTFVSNSEGWEGKKVLLFFTFGSGLGKERAEIILRKKIQERQGEVVSSLRIKGSTLKNAERVRERVKFFLDSSLP
ncbi:MAG TPA: hypothetical protein ENG13_02970 [bacterium]|nr:hypothetical protein [bacterium]HEX68009.1 hypothetical protein [bacterium]